MNTTKQQNIFPGSVSQDEDGEPVTCMKSVADNEQLEVGEGGDFRGVGQGPFF